MFDYIFPCSIDFLLQTQNAKLQPLKNSLIKREKDNLPSILYLQFYTRTQLYITDRCTLFVWFSLMSEKLLSLIESFYVRSKETAKSFFTFQIIFRLFIMESCLSSGGRWPVGCPEARSRSEGRSTRWCTSSCTHTTFSQPSGHTCRSTCGGNDISPPSKCFRLVYFKY